jgi:hypothetical protein
MKELKMTVGTNLVNDVIKTTSRIGITIPKKVFRVNKRSDQVESSKKLTSLINIYHYSSNFIPISTKINTLSPFIDNTFIKDTSFYPAQPIKPINLILANKLINQEAYKFNNKSTTLLDLDLHLLAPTADRIESIDSKKQSINRSFQANWKYGSEPPLSNRVRRLLDTLHGTTAGGQPGLQTIRQMKDHLGDHKLQITQTAIARREKDKEEDLAAEGFGEGFGNE